MKNVARFVFVGALALGVSGCGAGRSVADFLAGLIAASSGEGQCGDRPCQDPPVSGACGTVACVDPPGGGVGACGDLPCVDPPGGSGRR